MSSAGAARRAAVPVSKARAEASRRNGAKSRGPKTPEGKARSSRNALKHGLRAQKYVVLPQEDAAEFAALQAALLEELAPVGALQTVLARRVAIAAWRLARADRMEADVLEERGYGNASPGVALLRDGNGTRAVETLLRYRGAAMAEFWRALRTLKALQAQSRDAGAGRATLPARPLQSNEPKKACQHNDLDSDKASIGASSGIEVGAERCRRGGSQDRSDDQCSPHPLTLLRAASGVPAGGTRPAAHGRGARTAFTSSRRDP